MYASCHHVSHDASCSYSRICPLLSGSCLRFDVSLGYVCVSLDAVSYNDDNSYGGLLCGFFLNDYCGAVFRQHVS